MSTSAQLKNFLHHTLFSKFKVKLTLQQFNDILSQAQRLAKISDQGLILIALTQQLQRQVTLNYAAIKKLISELQATQKKQKPKRSKNQDDSRPIPRRRRPKDISNQGLDLDNLAHQSVSNPSNLQRGRQNVSVHSGLIDDISNPNSQQQSKDSKDSKDNQKQVGYKEKLNKISEQLQIPADTYLTNDNNLENMGLGIEVPDSQTETSNSLGMISNLNEKMKIFDGQRRDFDPTKTKKKSNRKNRPTATKKIGLNMTIDQKLSLQETRISMNQTFSLNQTKTKASFEDLNMIDKYTKFAEYLDVNSALQKLLEPTCLQKIIQVLVQSKPQFQQNYPSNFPHQELTNYENQQQQYIDFTSQQTGNFVNNQEISTIHIQFNSIGINLQEKIGLNDLSRKCQKSKVQLFYQMLKLAQNGEIIMEQSRPEEFSEIFVYSQKPEF